MTIKCPRCNYKYDLLEDRREEAYLQIVRLAGGFGPHADLVLEYALLRNGVKQVRVRELKLLRIMTDLERLWSREEFSFNGRLYKISRQAILQCFKLVCDRHFTEPLTNDNYLKKIMATVAEKEATKRSAEQEKELIRKEKEQRNLASRKDEKPFDPETGKQKVRELLAKLGGSNE